MLPYRRFSVASLSKPTLVLKLTLVLVVLAVGPSNDAFAQSVTTTTNYEYDEETLNLRSETVSSTNYGYRRTEYEYAHEQPASGGMESLNMLSQIHRTVVKNAGGYEVACSQVDWYSSSPVAYVPKYWGVGCNSELVYSANADDVGDYDDLGRLLRVQSGGLTTEYFYGDPAPASPSGSFSNSESNPYLTGIRMSGYGVAGADYGEMGRYLTQRFVYDSHGRLTERYGANDREIAFLYDGLGRLRETRNDAGQTVTKHEYSFTGSGSGTYDPAEPNRVTTIQYGSPRRALSMWYDGLGREIGSTSYESGYYDDVSLTEYNERGRPYRAWRPARINAGGSRSLTSGTWNGGLYLEPDDFAIEAASYWDGQDGIDSGDAAYAYTETTFEDNPLGRPSFVRDPGSDGNGVTYRYGIDAPDAMLPSSGCSGPSGAQWCAREAGAGQMAYTEIEDADGRRTRTYTDGLGRERFIRAGMGSTVETLTEMIYDAAGRLVEVRHPNYFRPRTGESSDRMEHRTLYTYDTRGHLTAKETPDAGLEKMAYDEVGRLRYHQDADQRALSTHGHVTIYRYDGMGRMTSSHRGTLACPFESVTGNGVSCYDGDWGSSVTESGLGETLRMMIYDDPTDNQYDNANRPYEWPWYVDDSFVFDNTLGRLAAEAYRSDGKWWSVAYSYLNSGRIKNRSVNTQGVDSPVADFSYSYDVGGLLKDRKIEVGAYAFREVYTHQADGRVDYVRSGVAPAGSTPGANSDARYYYDAAGALERTYFYGMSGAGSGQRYEYRRYDIEGRLTHIQTPYYGDSPFREEITYTSGGLIQSTVFKGADAGTYSASNSPHDSNASLRAWRFYNSYDALGRLTESDYGSPYYDLPSYSVSGIDYDSNGNILSLTRRAPTDASGSGEVDDLTYTYTSGTNRLYEVDDAANTQTWYEATWDANSSRHYYRANGASYRQYEYPQEGWGSKTNYRYVYRYDERGMPLYSYNRQVDETQYDSYAYIYISNRYDGDGQRIWRRVSGGGILSEERYVRDVDGSVVAVLDGDLLKYWNNATGRMGGNGARYIYRRDHLGSVRAVQRGSDGELIEARDYYPFGLQMPGRVYVTGEETKEGYTGHELDIVTGRYYAGARYYLPALGRWTSTDPLEEYASGYVYVGNNPVSLTDPTGMYSWNDSGSMSSVVGRMMNHRQSAMNTSFYGSGSATQQADPPKALVGLSVLVAGINGGLPSIEDRVQGVASTLSAATTLWRAGLYKESLAAGLFGVLGAAGILMDPTGTASMLPGPSAITSTGSVSVSALARAAQGTRRYPGVDVWRDITLKRGTILYRGEPRGTEFFTTSRGFLRSGDDATTLFRGLQVAPSRTLGYRPGVTAYRVLEDTPAAFGITRANVQYGPGGYPQVFVPNYESATEALISHILFNRFPQ